MLTGLLKFVRSFFLTDQTVDPPTVAGGSQVYSKGGKLYQMDGAGVVSDVSLNNQTKVGVAGIPDVLSATFFQEGANIEIKSGSIGATQLATAVDATAIAFNADKVDGTDVNDIGTTTADLWTANKIQSQIDLAVQGVSWQEPVLNSQTDAILDPGVTPVTGDRYIINNSAALNANFGTITGIGNGDIVEYDGVNFFVSWDASVQGAGGAVWDQGSNKQEVYNGTAWVTFGSTVTHNNTSGIQGGAANDYYHLTVAQQSAITGGFNADAQHIHSFIAMDDTPASLVGQNGNFVKVNATATALEFVTAATDNFTQIFTNANLTSGVLTVPHNLNQQFVHLTVADNNNDMLIPDKVTFTSNTALSIDLTSFGPLTGSWNLVVSR